MKPVLAYIPRTRRAPHVTGQKRLRFCLTAQSAPARLPHLLRDIRGFRRSTGGTGGTGGTIERSDERRDRRGNKKREREREICELSNNFPGLDRATSRWIDRSIARRKKEGRIASDTGGVRTCRHIWCFLKRPRKIEGGRQVSVSLVPTASLFKVLVVLFVAPETRRSTTSPTYFLVEAYPGFLEIHDTVTCLFVSWKSTKGIQKERPRGA